MQTLWKETGPMISHSVVLSVSFLQNS